MSVFSIGDFTVYPGITGGRGRWTAHYSIATNDVGGEEQRIAVTGVPGVFTTQGEAMEAAREAGRLRILEMTERDHRSPLA